MTSREKEILQAVKELGGIARSYAIGGKVGISTGYAEQLCRDLVWMGHLAKKGLKYKLNSK